MAVLPTMLQPQIVMDRFSRLKVTNDAIQRGLGLQAGGPKEKKTPSRRGSYDIYDESRSIGSASAPGVEATTRQRFPVGQVNFNIPRHAEKIPMPMEELNQLRPLGGPVSKLDELGEQYILAQEQNQKRIVTSIREFQCAAMLRGSYTWSRSGNSLQHTFSGGEVTINFLIPAGNKTKLDMLGGGDIIGSSWANSAAPIVRDLLQINQAFIQLTGLMLKDVWVNSVVWGHIITNTEVQSVAGSVNAPVKSFDWDSKTNVGVGILNAIPWVTFHICDEVLDVNGTTTRLIADTAAVFLVDLNAADVMHFMVCPEPIVDPVTQQVSNVYGEHFYYKVHDDPAVYELHSRFNGMPALLIPKGVAYGTVVY